MQTEATIIETITQQESSVSYSNESNPAELQEKKLCDHVKDAMNAYFKDMDGHDPKELYELFISQVEKPFFEVVMEETNDNISKASAILGMNRVTLRTRLKKYGLHKNSK